MPNKTALVTGASEGIGAEFIQILAARGYDLILVARSEDKLNRLAAKAETEFNIKCTVIVADLSQSKAAHNLFQRVHELSLDVNFLVNNAGLLKNGFYADIVVFDPNKIKDNATFNNPIQYAEGVEHVMVNGQIVLENGKHTNIFSGKFIKWPGYKEN